MKRIGGFTVFRRSPRGKKQGLTATGRAITSRLKREESEAAHEKAVADRLAALLATAPKVTEAPGPPKVEHENSAETQQDDLQTTIVPDPPPAPIPARELTGAELQRIARLAQDIAVEVQATWQQIKREGDAWRAQWARQGVPASELVIEFTPTCGGRCEKHDYPLLYVTDWRAPVCRLCETEQKT